MRATSLALSVAALSVVALSLGAAALADKPGQAPEAPPAAAAQPPPRLTLPIEGDQAIEVVLGPPKSRVSIVYMHGVCGDPLAFESWVRAATAHATFISMRGDLPCKSQPGRRKWSMRWSHLDARIAEALEVAARERGRSLDRDEVVLVGYSQGAARVEALAAAFPKRYRRVALIASPVEPSASRLGRAERTVLMAGGWDAREHIHKASLALARAGRDALYLELPKARHGEYGPDAERVMGRGLDWLFNGRASD